jgi:hypothetical protein
MTRDRAAPETTTVNRIHPERGMNVSHVPENMLFNRAQCGCNAGGARRLQWPQSPDDAGQDSD